MLLATMLAMFAMLAMLGMDMLGIDMLGMDIEGSMEGASSCVAQLSSSDALMVPMATLGTTSLACLRR